MRLGEARDRLFEIAFHDVEFGQATAQQRLFASAASLLGERQAPRESVARLSVAPFLQRQHAQVVERERAPPAIATGLPACVGALEVAQRCHAIALDGVRPAQVIVDVGERAGVVGKRPYGRGERVRLFQRCDRLGYRAVGDQELTSGDMIGELEPRRQDAYRHLVEQDPGARVVALEPGQAGVEDLGLPARLGVADRLDSCRAR